VVGSSTAQAQVYQGPAPQAAIPSPAGVSNFPIASDARLAGDAKQTRFILDLDKAVQFRAFALADPYRVIVDLPQVSFQLPAGAGVAGRGLVKAFRYGLVMPGGSRIVFDLTGPAKIAKSYVLEAANGQPPRLVPELEEVDRTAFVQSLPPENRPELRPAIAGRLTPPLPSRMRQPRRSLAPGPPDKRPVVVIDPATAASTTAPRRRRQRHHGKEPGAHLRAGAARPAREIGQVSRRHDPDGRHLHSAR
jgi:N-acetylmuramoyl-L-alanine amidase